MSDDPNATSVDPALSRLSPRRLTDAQWQKLIDTVELAPRRNVKISRRDHGQQRYPKVLRAIIRINQRTNASNFIVRTRNISAGGASFVLGCFLHIETPCSLVLQTPEGTGLLTQAHVRWCRFLQGQFHEIGVQFTEPIDLTLFLTDKELREGESASD